MNKTTFYFWLHLGHQQWVRLLCLLELTLVPDFHPDVDVYTSSPDFLLYCSNNNWGHSRSPPNRSVRRQCTLYGCFADEDGSVFSGLTSSSLNPSVGFLASCCHSWCLALTSSVWVFLCVGMLEHVDACTYTVVAIARHVLVWMCSAFTC